MYNFRDIPLWDIVESTLLDFFNLAGLTGLVHLHQIGLV